jgi:hypothetical protein
MLLLHSLAHHIDAKKRSKKKRMWVKDWISRRSDVHPLYKEIEETDPVRFHQAFRMYPDMFDHLLSRFVVN